MFYTWGAVDLKVSGILIEDIDANFLIVRRSSDVKNPKLWGIPAGVVGAGLDEKETALTKTKQEVNISFYGDQIKQLKRFEFSLGCDNYMFYTYHAKINSVKPTVALNRDGLMDYEWMKKEEILKKDDILPNLSFILKSLT